MAEHSIDLIPGLVRGHKRDGRCVYNKAAKRELVARCMEPGVSLARLAMAHGVNANLLRKWVMKQTGARPPRQRKSPVTPTRSVSLLPVKLTQPEPVTVPDSPAGYLELVVTGSTIRVHGRIEAASLSVVLDCLAKRA
jgi:transposase-like protein